MGRLWGALKNSIRATIEERPAVVETSPRRGRMACTFATAAASLAVVFFGLWALTSRQLDEADQIAAVYEAVDAVVVDLETANGPARFVNSPILAQGVFNGARLAEVAADEIYELWLIGGDNAMDPAGTVSPGDDGVLVENVAPGLTLAMTVELAPGVDAPLTTPCSRPSSELALRTATNPRRAALRIGGEWPPRPRRTQATPAAGWPRSAGSWPVPVPSPSPTSLRPPPGPFGPPSST